MKRLVFGLAIVASALMSSAASADVIGVNFAGRSSPNTTTLTSGQQAGVAINGVVQDNWNNTPTQNPPQAAETYSSLMNSNGAATGVSLTASYNDSFYAGSGASTPDNTLMDGILKANGTGTTDTLTWKGLTTGGVYDAYLYLDENSGPANGHITAGTTTFYVREPNGSTSPITYTQATSTTPGTYSAGNYVEFTDLTAVAGQIAISFTFDGNGSDGFGVAAAQLVSLPEPSSLVALVGLAGIGMIGLLWRRRRAAV
jgi:hypothetical protein